MNQDTSGTQSSVYSKMFSPDVIEFKGVEIHVTPLPFWRVPVVWDEISAIVLRLFSRNASENETIAELAENVMTLLHGKLGKLLTECVSIPEEPAFDMKLLPSKLFPRIMKLIIEQNFEPGEWQDLAQLVGWERIEASMRQALMFLIKSGPSLSTMDTPTAKSDDTPQEP